MKGRFIFLLLFTGITGFAVGVYAYFVTRDVTAPTSDVGEQITSGYEVFVTTYGGCERAGCASLRITDRGEYTYLAPTQVGEYMRYEDSLTYRQHEELSSLIERTRYHEVQEHVFTGTCPAAYDGLSYRFDIRHEGERFQFDSCEVFIEDEPLFLELIRYIDIMNATYHAR